MQIRSIYRGARISAFKCRDVTREIQGKPVALALDILAFSPKKAARLVEKTLRSAIANAENNNNLRVDKLVVQEAVVGEGATIKRFRPKARGSAGTIRKRTSHIRVIVTDEIEIPENPKKAARAKKAKGKSPPKKGAAKAAKSEAKKEEPAAEAAPAPAEAPGKAEPAAV